MAKNKNDKPSAQASAVQAVNQEPVNPFALDAPATALSPPAALANPTPGPAPVPTITADVKLPLHLRFTDSGYLPRSPEVRFKYPEARLLRALAHGLSDKVVKLRDGRPIRHSSHALQWIIEQLADQVGDQAK